jgi:hypothetical protein
LQLIAPHRADRELLAAAKGFEDFKMTVIFLIGVIIFGIAVLAGVGFLGKKIVPAKLNQEFYQTRRWSELLTKVKQTMEWRLLLLTPINY